MVGSGGGLWVGGLVRETGGGFVGGKDGAYRL